MAFLGGLLRVLIGFILACLAAGAVKVLFAVTPAELIDAGTEYWQQGGIWALYTSTMIAVFAFPFAMLSAIFSEWQGIRSFAYHGFIGIAIAVAGFILIATGESPDSPSIFNSYAMAAFLTTGLVSGFVYWLFAGRFAYRSIDDDEDDDLRSGTTRTVKPEDKTAAAKPTLGSRTEGGSSSQGRTSDATATSKPEDKPSTGSVPKTRPTSGRTFDA